jgi:hypothetical protein
MRCTRAGRRTGDPAKKVSAGTSREGRTPSGESMRDTLSANHYAHDSLVFAPRRHLAERVSVLLWKKIFDLGKTDTAPPFATAFAFMK